MHSTCIKIINGAIPPHPPTLIMAYPGTHKGEVWENLTNG